MNYRKLVKSKKAIANFAETVRTSIQNSSKKVQEYTENRAENFAEGAKTAITDLKETVNNAIKNKMEEEFRKNYHCYVVDVLDEIIIQAMSAGVSDIEVSQYRDCNDDQYSVAELFRKAANGMISDEMAESYISDRLMAGLFDFLVNYYENEPQVKAISVRDILCINIPVSTSTVTDETIEEVDSNDTENENEIKETEE